VEFVKSHLKISSSGSSGELRLSLVSSAPDDARAVLGAIMSAYVKTAEKPQSQAATPTQPTIGSQSTADAQSTTDSRSPGAGSTVSSQSVNSPSPANALLQSDSHSSPDFNSQAANQVASTADAGSVGNSTDAGGTVNPTDAGGNDIAPAQIPQLSQPAPSQPLVVTISRSPETLDVILWPKPIPVFALAMAIGLALGVAMAAIWDAASDKPCDPIDASMTARAPILGSVPALPPELSSPALRGQSVLVRPSTASGAGWGQISRAMESVFVPSFDKTILFTSPDKARGKTLLASNMAIAMAKAGHRVVLVDGHASHSSVGEIFGAEDSTGLADAVEGRVKLTDALKVTGLRELEVLPAGHASSPWSQILNSQNFIQVLNELSDRFDRVLIDAGPAASLECRILSAYCDLAVLLTDARAGTRRDLRAAADGIRMLGARLAGVVWNHSPRRASNDTTGAHRPTPAGESDAATPAASAGSVAASGESTTARQATRDQSAGSTGKPRAGDKTPPTSLSTNL
jgi:capsular exopolysaccharide synthesis family protein